MIVTISGKPASGKSTVARLLARKLGCRHYSAGDMQREIARDKGKTISELGEFESQDGSIDRMIDDRLKAIGQSEDSAVVDAWLAPCFIPNAFHVFLDGEEDVLTRRRLKHKRKEETLPDFEQAKRDMRKRMEVNSKRWKEFYDYDYSDMSNYELVIDTTSIPPKKVVERIIQALPTKPF
jgi:cytidylate kinase